jgi:hypothetical protein
MATGAAAQETGAVEIHGYVDLTYFDFQKESDPVLPYTDGFGSPGFKGDPTFDNNHMTFYFGADIADNIRFNSEFHFEHSYKELEMPEASISWEWSEPFVLTFGRFWLPFGTLGKYRIYAPTNGLVSYPYTVSMLMPFHNAEYGIKAGGHAGMLGYEVAAVNGASGLDEASGGDLSSIGFAQDNNQNKRVVGNIELNPVEGLDLRASYTTGKWDDTNEADLSFWGAVAAYHIGRFNLLGEYAQGDVENPIGTVGGITGPLTDNLGPMATGDINRSSYFAQADVQILEDQAGVNSLDLIVRYDAFDRDDRDEAGDRTRWSFGLNLSPAPHLHFKAEYQKVDEEEGFEVDNDGVMLQAVADF